jgi:hypothetical protein
MAVHADIQALIFRGQDELPLTTDQSRQWPIHCYKVEDEHASSDSIEEHRNSREPLFRRGWVMVTCLYSMSKKFDRCRYQCLDFRCYEMINKVPSRLVLRVL